jgi:hypothetical protein
MDDVALVGEPGLLHHAPRITRRNARLVARVKQTMFVRPSRSKASFRIAFATSVAILLFQYSTASA